MADKNRRCDLQQLDEALKQKTVWFQVLAPSAGQSVSWINLMLGDRNISIVRLPAVAITGNIQPYSQKDADEINANIRKYKKDVTYTIQPRNGGVAAQFRIGKTPNDPASKLQNAQVFDVFERLADLWRAVNNERLRRGAMAIEALKTMPVDDAVRAALNPDDRSALQLFYSKGQFAGVKDKAARDALLKVGLCVNTDITTPIRTQFKDGGDMPNPTFSIKVEKSKPASVQAGEPYDALKGVTLFDGRRSVMRDGRPTFEALLLGGAKPCAENLHLIGRNSVIHTSDVRVGLCLSTMGINFSTALVTAVISLAERSASSDADDLASEFAAQLMDGEGLSVDQAVA